MSVRLEDLTVIKSIRGGRVHGMEWKIHEQMHDAKVH